MTHPQASNHEPAIVDVVFSSVGRLRGRSATLLAFLGALAAHFALGAMALKTEPSLEFWSAALAVRVHAELSREQTADLTAPPPPSIQQPPPTQVADRVPDPPKEELRPEIRRAVRKAWRSAPQPPHTPPARESDPAPAPPPAQAGQLLAQAVDPDAPLDLTDQTFITGSATAYAGGVTTSQGTSAEAVHTHNLNPNGETVHGRGRGDDPDRRATVQLPSGQWQCPWPTEADDEQIYEQTAVIRVLVRKDGTVESGSVVEDPGHGFGSAAIACARTARFSPAKDSQGKPIRSMSPPIRVRFTR